MNTSCQVKVTGLSEGKTTKVNLTYKGNIYSVDVSVNSLPKMSATYSDGSEVDLNNVCMYENKMCIVINNPFDFDIDVSDYIEGDIYFQADSSGKQSFSSNPYIDPISLSFWEIKNNKLKVYIEHINDTTFHLEPNTTYTIDLSDITVNGVKCPEVNNVYSFTTGWGITVSKTFSFTNSETNFVKYNEESTYNITDEFLEQEISNNFGGFQKEVYIRPLLNRKWNGACFGLSAVMILANNHRINYEIDFSSNPLDNCSTPYCLRDFIHYYYATQKFYTLKTNGFTNVERMRNLMIEASLINNETQLI